LIRPRLCPDSAVLDVGCAMGGFLDYLHAKKIRNLSGIDLSEHYVRAAQQTRGPAVRLGRAEAMPFGDGVFDAVVMDQVLEHLSEPRRAFREAARVLVPGGLLCLGVPDASRYGENAFFDLYWFLLREHIQHFDIDHLNLLAGQEGFELADVSRSATPIMSQAMILPNLNAVFRLTGRPAGSAATAAHFTLKKEIASYIAAGLAGTREKESIIGELAASRKPVYAWGIGREFFYLFESAGLRRCAIAGLIDENRFKQQSMRVSGRALSGRDVLDTAGSGTAVILTATAHAGAIKELLKKAGYTGQVVEFPPGAAG